MAHTQAEELEYSAHIENWMIKQEIARRDAELATAEMALDVCRLKAKVNGLQEELAEAKEEFAEAKEELAETKTCLATSDYRCTELTATIDALSREMMFMPNQRIGQHLLGM
jgi:hypothetical protein